MYWMWRRMVASPISRQRYASGMERLMDLVQRTAAFLQEKGLENGRREAEWIFAETLGLKRLDLYTQFDRLLDDDEVGILRSLVMRRSKREPLAYVLGTQDFCGLTLEVDPSVLVPRPETEELVEAILKSHDSETKRVVDVGTGSGAIALALKHARPEWSVTGCDISAEALNTATRNGERCGLTVSWISSDLLTACPGPWDVVVANLPYVSEEERSLMDPETEHEPQLALFAENSGMTLIQRLIEALPTCLVPKGEAWLEHGFAQAQDVAEAAEAMGYHPTTFKDLGGQDRYTRLLAASMDS